MGDHSFSLKDISLGVASASTQIEGDIRNNNWYDWYKAGKIHDQTSPEVADQHWRLWREDTELMASLGIGYARIGIEWGRIEPEEGKFDEQVLGRYRQELRLLRGRGIKPLVTLWHFSDPRWFVSQGGFESPAAVRIFSEFVEQAVRALGPDVESWITVNEPNVYAFNGYLAGSWPPGAKSFRRMRKVLDTLIACHIAAYRIIHAAYPDARVGTALHVRAFDPENPRNPWHCFAAAQSERLFQGSLAKAMNTGRSAFPYRASQPGRYYDFIGLNYYSRSTCRGFADGVKANTPRNDLNWEIYPEGIRRAALKFHALYPAPVYITENGTCDNRDRFRSRYIYDHLQAIHDLGFVERYYHWCFIDNWEWLEGQSARFGIVKVDYATQQRTVKQSGEFYREVIRAQGVTEELYQKYVRGQEYDVR